MRDKEKPRKIIENWYSYYCPNCHTDLLSYVKNYKKPIERCNKCGQKLEWKESEKQ